MTVKKGCILESTLKSENSTKYDPNRKCYTSTVGESDFEDDATLPGSVQELAEALKVTDPESVSLKEQHESCLCYGSYCNSGSHIFPALFLIFIALILAMLML